MSNGERTEVGGEIHAEIAVLIKTGMHADSPENKFVIAGLDSKGNELLGRWLYPCHACAMAIKFAGYKGIYIKDEQGEPQYYSINQIIIDREQEWEPA